MTRTRKTPSTATTTTTGTKTKVSTVKKALTKEELINNIRIWTRRSRNKKFNWKFRNWKFRLLATKNEEERNHVAN